MPLARSTIAGYELREEIAREGSYAFFRAEHEATRARVVVKTPVRGASAAAIDFATLAREYDVLKKAQGEGIAQAVRFDPPYLVLGDLLPLPLRRLPRPLTIERFLVISENLARALARVHSAGFIHRSFRNEGIFVDPNTLKVELADFASASRLSEIEIPATTNLSDIAQSALSPEQTGRMNRVVDYRCDFYALGVVFYQLLTGRPPFDEADPLALVHFHIARAPVAPSILSSAVPPGLSDIVMKLLAKMPEDRYQSAEGLIADIRTFRQRWDERHDVSAFPLATEEAASRFTVPQRLYGRSGEVDTLVTAFYEAAKGKPSFVFVRGDAGSGKTSLVNEIHKPIADRRGRFLFGKFDQVERSVPYSALVQAMRGLFESAMASDFGEQPGLSARLRAALGKSAGVLASVVPELTRLIGPCQSPQAVDPAQAQNQFTSAFETLLRTVARTTEPLVIFLDDLQWADMATLRLLSSVLSTETTLPVLWVGAFRDGEVRENHPLVRFRYELRDHGVSTQDLQLSPLRRSDLLELLRDALNHELEALGPLSDLVLEKTGGNPFFVVQFLKSLHVAGYLKFERTTGRWDFDLKRVQAADMTDNVLELMTRKLHHLQPASLEAVKAAACIGSPFTIDTLAMLRKQSPEAAAADLWESVAEGLVVPMQSNYELLTAFNSSDKQVTCRFLHDRVQQAAYALIPEDHRRSLHLEMGSSLLARYGERSDRLFEIVGHLNLAQELHVRDEDRRHLAALDLAAGRRARASAAVQTAWEHFRAGEALLKDDADDDLRWTLCVEAAECEFICGDETLAEERLDRVIASSSSLALRAEAARIRIVRYENTGRFIDGVRVAREALARMGVEISSDPTARRLALEEAVRSIDERLTPGSIEALLQLPEMNDEKARQAARLIVAAWPSAFLTNEAHLTDLFSAKLIQLSFHKGQTHESALGYITFAITANARRNSYDIGNQLAHLGLAIDERFAERALSIKVQHLFGSFLSAWYEPLVDGAARAQATHQAALQVGDFTYAARAGFMETWYRFFSGEHLSRFESRAWTNVAFLSRIRHEVIERAQRVLLQWARCLRGLTSSPLSLSDAGFAERDYDQAFENVPVFKGFLCIARAHIAYCFGDFDLAAAQANQATQALSGSAQTIWHAHIDFYGALIDLARARHASAATTPVLAKIESVLPQIRARADACPKNFAYQYHLVQAEREALSGDPDAALAHFTRGVAASRESGFPSAQALAYELKAAFHASRGETGAAREAMLNATSYYDAWGARAKVSALTRSYPELVSGSPVPSVHADFDTASALKAAQAMAAEIEWERLLPRLMHIVIENAGAERGVLVEQRGEELVVVASDSIKGQPISSGQVPVDPVPDLPQSIVEHVYRSGQALVLSDARAATAWADDPYVQRANPRAILCVPIIRQGKARGVLYLENGLSSDVFSDSRKEIVEVLASQAAISLENARLYASMKEEVKRRGEAETALKHALSDLEALKNRLLAENVYLQEEIRSQHNFEEIIGNAPSLLDALGKVERVAQTDSTVLVTGETGTGKELIARAIHSRSTRSSRPLVKVNCGAIASGLVESELFGHVKGAFTGALQRRAGRFELADGGTLFLDEVGELPLEAQTKLLRVLQEQEFEPVGSSATRRVDVRIIAATNRDLEDLVRAGRFRADLLYRLNVFPIHVPPLRERPEDVPLLISFFVTRLSKKLGKALESFSQADMARLVGYPWTGNVRELQNVVERAAILTQGPVLTLDSQFSSGAPLSAPPSESSVPEDAPASGGVASRSTRRINDIEREHILHVLESTSWVVEGARGAATILGLHPNTLRSRMKRLGIVRTRP